MLFAISLGSTLLIGITDSGEVLSLESDRLSLGGVDRDKFEIPANPPERPPLGSAFGNSKVEMTFSKVEEF